MKTTRRNFIGSIAAGGAYAALPGGFAVAADASGRALPVPAEAQKRRANADWLKGSVGVSSHWTNNTRRLDGAKPAFSDAVDGFDVAGYADAIAQAGAKHCIFTLAHAQQYLPCPLAELDRILPGRTARRDLIGELIAALDARGIRFIAYYNHSCNGHDDPPWMDACGYSRGKAGDLDLFQERICSIVGALSRRYGKGISGWWLDSAGSVDQTGPGTVSCDMGDWRWSWPAYIGAARSGNPDAVVAVNAGIYKNYEFTDLADYCAGEATSLEDKFDKPPRDIVRHHWTILDDDGWVFCDFPWGKGRFAPGRYSDAALISFLDRQLSQGRMTTFNVGTDARGVANPFALGQIRRCLGWLRGNPV